MTSSLRRQDHAAEAPVPERESRAALSHRPPDGEWPMLLLAFACFAVDNLGSLSTNSDAGQAGGFADAGREWVGHRRGHGRRPRGLFQVLEPDPRPRFPQELKPRRADRRSIFCDRLPAGARRGGQRPGAAARHGLRPARKDYLRRRRQPAMPTGISSRLTKAPAFHWCRRPRGARPRCGTARFRHTGADVLAPPAANGG